MNIFSDRSHYNPEHRSELFPLLRQFWKDKNGLNPNVISNIRISDAYKSDVAILPMSWNYYLTSNKLDLAFSYIKKARESEISVWAWTSGDFGVEPLDKNVVTFRPSGYSSKISTSEKGMPIFFHDPLKLWFKISDPLLREKKEVSVVGFCGYTSSNPLKWMKQSTQTVIRNSMYYLGSRYEQPQTLQSPLFLRNKVLRTLIKSEKVYTNFIFRSKYRADAIDQVDRLRTAGEYFNNIFDSDYVVCVRGGGNFSVRFYETLAMGRIPILIDTNCILPFDDIIDWRQHIVRIRPEEFNQIDILVKNFHSNLTNKAFKEIQQKNRELWLTHLSTQFWSKVMKYYVERKNFEVINN